MKNIDIIKENLCAQIKNMPAEKFLDFMDELQECDDGIFDLGMLFSCKKCKKIYGKCKEADTTDECAERFLIYANDTTLSLEPFSK